MCRSLSWPNVDVCVHVCVRACGTSAIAVGCYILGPKHSAFGTTWSAPSSPTDHLYNLLLTTYITSPHSPTDHLHNLPLTTYITSPHSPANHLHNLLLTTYIASPHSPPDHLHKGDVRQVLTAASAGSESHAHQLARTPTGTCTGTPTGTRTGTPTGTPAGTFNVYACIRTLNTA